MRSLSHSFENRAFNAAYGEAMRFHPEMDKIEKQLEEDLVVNMEHQAAELDKFVSREDREELQNSKRLKKQEGEWSEADLRSKIFEAGVIYETNRRNGIFGPEAEAYKTSEYDDVVNGIDLVVRASLTEKNSEIPIEFSADVTVGVDTLVIKKKLDRIKEDIERNRSSHIRLNYGKAKDGSVGRRENHPRLVLAVDPRTYEQAAVIWAKGDRKGEGNQELRNALLAETKAQLREQLFFILLCLDKIQFNKSITSELREIFDQGDQEVIGGTEMLLEKFKTHLGKQADSNADLELLQNTLNAFKYVISCRNEKRDSAHGGIPDRFKAVFTDWRPNWV